MSRTLKQWEDYLAGAVPRVNLLSELDLSYEDMLEIANLIKVENAKRPNLHRTTAYLVEDFPCTFAAFLAAFAAQNTEREFWDALAALLSVTGGGLNNANWRKHFLSILNERGLPTFEDVGGATNRYVTSMRIHGGIPSYSLGDFFSHMLLPAVEKQEYIELKGQELLDALLRRSSVQIFTDSTVRNFFENSGDVGIRFLDSSCSLAREYIRRGSVPAEHNLPAYVVQRFMDFIENREDKKYGLRRPRLKFDPEGDGLLLELPEQSLSGAHVYGREVRWEVAQPNRLMRVTRRIAGRGRDTFSEEGIVSLGFLSEPFRVSFHIPVEGGEYRKIREWSFDLFSRRESNLLVFRKEDASLLNWSQALPAQDLLLVFPKEITLQFAGSHRTIYTPEIYAEGWSNWNAEYVSLEGAWSITLLKDGQEIAIIPVQKQPEAPALLGIPFTPNLDSKPLYIGEPPRLRIPLRAGTRPEDELSRWQLELSSVWDSEPALRQTFRLSEKQESVEWADSAVELDLSTMLGKEPKGTYSLRATGPMEMEAEFAFRVWPQLTIKDLPHFILPSKDGKTAFRIRLPVSGRLEVQAGADGIDLMGQYGFYTVEFDDHVSRVDLNLVWPLDQSQVSVPFSLPVPRLQWRFALGDESKVEWSNGPMHMPLESILQSGQMPALIVRMPGIATGSERPVLTLVDPDNPKEELQRFPPQVSPLGDDYLRFALNARDTLNHYVDISAFEFRLWTPSGEGIPEPVTVLSLARDMIVSSVRIELTDENLFLLWKEPHVLKNRRVLIRSTWKGWVPAWTIRIPNDAHGELDLLAEGYGLPPSRYEIHFYVASPWESDKAEPGDQAIYVVQTISPEAQLAWLDNQLQKHPEKSFLNHFERACILAGLGETERRDHEIQVCYEDVEKAKPTELIAFYEWLETHDPMTGRAVRMKMYRPEHLQCLFDHYPPGDEFRTNYLSFVIGTDIRPESAHLLLENENDPSIMFHALRQLIRRRDSRTLKTIIVLIESARLSEAEAIHLMDLERRYYLSELDFEQSTALTLRLLSGLLQNQPEAIALLSSDKLSRLVDVIKEPETMKKYLGILIERGDKRGIESTMSVFEKGMLLGEEVTEILGKNPKFSLSILRESAQTHAYAIQASELRRQYPTETGYLSPGLLICTPCGWGKIESIDTADSAHVDSAAWADEGLRFYITLYPDTGHSIDAILDMEREQLQLLGQARFFQCRICGFVATTQNFIIRNHTREAHNGMGSSFSSIAPHLPVYGELRTSKPIH